MNPQPIRTSIIEVIEKAYILTQIDNQVRDECQQCRKLLKSAGLAAQTHWTKGAISPGCEAEHDYNKH